MATQKKGKTGRTNKSLTAWFEREVRAGCDALTPPVKFALQKLRPECSILKEQACTKEVFHVWRAGTSTVQSNCTGHGTVRSQLRLVQNMVQWAPDHPHVCSKMHNRVNSVQLLHLCDHVRWQKPAHAERKTFTDPEHAMSAE